MLELDSSSTCRPHLPPHDHPLLQMHKCINVCDAAVGKVSANFTGYMYMSSTRDRGQHTHKKRHIDCFPFLITRFPLAFLSLFLSLLFLLVISPTPPLPLHSTPSSVHLVIFLLEKHLHPQFFPVINLNNGSPISSFLCSSRG